MSEIDNIVKVLRNTSVYILLASTIMLFTLINNRNNDANTSMVCLETIRSYIINNNGFSGYSTIKVPEWIKFTTDGVELLSNESKEQDNIIRFLHSNKYLSANKAPSKIVSSLQFSHKNTKHQFILDMPIKRIFYSDSEHQVVDKGMDLKRVENITDFFDYWDRLNSIKHVHTENIPYYQAQVYKIENTPEDKERKIFSNDQALIHNSSWETGSLNHIGTYPLVEAQAYADTKSIVELHLTNPDKNDLELKNHHGILSPPYFCYSGITKRFPYKSEDTDYGLYFRIPLLSQKQDINFTEHIDNYFKNEYVIDDFSKKLTILRNFTKGYQSSSFDTIESIIKREVARGGVRVDFLGFGILSSDLFIFGPIILFLLQLYFYIHYKYFLKYIEKRKGNVCLDGIPWIGLYSDSYSKIIFVLLTSVFPTTINSYLIFKNLYYGIFTVQFVFIFLFFAIMILLNIKIINDFYCFSKIKVWRQTNQSKDQNN